MRKSIPPLSRRDVLKLMTLGSGAWFFVACGRAATETRPSPTTAGVTATSPEPTPEPAGHATETPAPTAAEPTELPNPNISGLGELPEGFEAGRITPTDTFYEQTYDEVPSTDPFTWELSMSGNFDNPLTLSLTDLKQRSRVEVMRTLECIGNPAGGNLIGNAVWVGTSLASILQEAGIQEKAKFLHFFSKDEYETSIPLALGMDERSLLVYEMNGEDLPLPHGGPVRVLLPDVYGQKQPKWLLSIRASERESLGTWEEKGWSNEATIQVNSQIETPKLRQNLPAGVDFFVTGAAFSDSSGITSVEVSIDDGENWQDAQLHPGPNTSVWTLWSWVWEKPEPGKYVLLARATDGDGDTQESSSAFGVLDNVFPNGTSLMHRVSVTVI